MPRIAGVDLPEQKRIEAALTYIYGVGRVNVQKVLSLANVDPNKRAKDITDQEISRIIKALETIPTEGTLRKMVADNVQRLKQIRSYRGMRHLQRLPSRGQRTRANARTRRGKRQTIGALTKEMAQKLEDAKKKK
jgi:small subunit ribosomal protein S13